MGQCSNCLFARSIGLLANRCSSEAGICLFTCQRCIFCWILEADRTIKRQREHTPRLPPFDDLCNNLSTMMTTQRNLKDLINLPGCVCVASSCSYLLNLNYDKHRVIAYMQRQLSRWHSQAMALSIDAGANWRLMCGVSQFSNNLYITVLNIFSTLSL